VRILLPDPIAKRLRRELRQAGRREIGGLLMGEHVESEVFRLADISVQHSGGSRSCFVRHPHEHRAELDRFFERTGGNYKRFNYLGEWHSHPSFAPVPSATDFETMQEIVEDPDVGVNFVVLIVVKLVGRNDLQISATAFHPGSPPVALDIVAEGQTAAVEEETGIFAWVRRLFTR
jgi:integrative and conjugative element protein (TIGR02256 family)